MEQGKANVVGVRVSILHGPATPEEVIQVVMRVFMYQAVEAVLLDQAHGSGSESRRTSWHMWKYDGPLRVRNPWAVELLEGPRLESLFCDPLPQLINFCLQQSPSFFGCTPLFVELVGPNLELLALRVVRHVGRRV